MNDLNSKKNLELMIDTSDNTCLRVQVLRDGEKILTLTETEYPKADQVLVLIDKIIKEQNVRLEDIQNINVHTGPGSYTGIRVGVAIANALAISLGISVNNKEIGELESPRY